jgi:hypothetical protein
LVLYYVSRALLSSLLGYMISTGTEIWFGSTLGLVMFLGFIWYAHSGRFLVDASNPLFPLRRDDRGRGIRDRPVVLAVGVGGLAYFILSFLPDRIHLKSQAGSLAFAVGMLTYFMATNWLFIKQ